MVTQLANRGPHSDVRSAKFGPQSTIGPKFKPSQVFVRELTVCLMHLEHANPHQIEVKTFFFLFLVSIAFSGSNSGDDLVFIYLFIFYFFRI